MPGLKAVVAVRLQDGEPLAHWHIALENISEQFILEWIDFPGISVPYDLHERGGNGKIFWPGAEGVVFDELQTRENSEYFKGQGSLLSVERHQRLLSRNLPHAIYGTLER